MFTRRFFLHAAAALGACPSAVYAQTSDDYDLMVTADGEELDVRSELEEQVEKYLNKSGLAARQRKGEIAVHRGYAQVKVNVDHPDWVKSRMLAYDEALKEAKSDWLRKQNSSIIGSVVSRVYRAGNQEPPPYNEADLLNSSKLAEIIGKIQAVGIGRLDNELRDLGVDPSKFEKVPPAQRHVQMSNEITRNVVIRSIGDLVGLSTPATFEGRDKSGNYMIAVVAVVSPKMKNHAQNVMRLRGKFQPDPAMAKDLSGLTENKMALLHDFGIRWLYDENGLPVIVSFYQWGVADAGNNKILESEYRNMAVKQAQDQADLQIAQFLSATATLTSKSQVGQKYEKAVERAVDGYVAAPDPSTSLVDALDQIFEERAKVDNLTGLETLSTWGVRHPVSKKMVVGAVRMWSAAGEQSTRAIKDARPAAPAASEPAKTGPGGVSKSRDLNKASDF